MRNAKLRSAIVILGILSLPLLPSFFRHLKFFLSGNVSRFLVEGNWVLVAINIVFFLAFILLINYRRSIDWTSATGYGVYTAFIVSLFVEMYGIPLTIFLGSGLIAAPSNPPSYLFGLHLLGLNIGLTLWFLIGIGITATGVFLVAAGWWQVYSSEGLATGGLYRYSRNPQYLGIILIALGWVVGWPTLLTITLFPLVLYAYYRLSKREEEDMLERHGEEYQSYMEETPLLI